MKFRRQAPLGPFIADFACFDPKLIVEADGGQHGGERDAARDAWFRDAGFKVLRFWNVDVMQAGGEGVVLAILREPGRG